jgi:amidase
LDATIPELQRAMRSGKLTSLELVDFYLDRIAAYDDAGPTLKALITVNPHARDEAAALDAERASSGPRGPLHGIPVVVKDNIDTAEMPTTGGASALADFRPTHDAFQVRKLRKAGAIILAKANLAELAQSWQTYSPVGGQTLNPYDPSREPGGSSGGTAVAVTANFAAVGLGNDGCGSNRLPAGLNNLYGLRPTSGLSSRTGVIPFAPILDEIGPMARTVKDLAILLDATAGKDPDDPTTVPLTTSFVDAVDADRLKGLRIGVLAFPYAERMGGVLQVALNDLAAGGVQLIDVALPDRLTSLPEKFFEEFPIALKGYLASEPTAPEGAFSEITGMDPDTLSPATLDNAKHRHLLAIRRSYRHQLTNQLDKLDLDAIAYPVSPTTARPIGSRDRMAGSATVHWNCATAAVTGLPALAVPVGFAPDGLPVGLELLGGAFDEPTLISIAAEYERHTDHRSLPPTTPPLGIQP